MGGNRSPEPAAVPAALLPLPPTPPPTSAPTTNAPEVVTTNIPVTIRRRPITSAPQTPAAPLPRINFDLQTVANNIAPTSRPQAVVPAFLQPSGGRSLPFSAPRARQLITDITSPDSNVAAVP